MSGPDGQRRKQKRQRDLAISKALRNRDETRKKLLEQGRELARRRAENVERNRGRDDGRAESTASNVHSTFPAIDTNEEAAARHSHSTVPARPRRSTVPAAERLYGLRLYDRLAPEDEDSTGVPSQDGDSREQTSVDADRTAEVSHDE